MDGIFISYRRDDSAGYAGRLYDRLVAHFGAARVFMDVEGIEPGVDFVTAIEDAVGSCRVLIVIIGDEWISATDTAGRRRLDDPNDFIRLETGVALKRGIRVVPVLVGNAAMPRADELPEDLRALARRQAVEVSHKQWDASTGELIRTLERILDPGGPDTPRARGAVQPAASATATTAARTAADARAKWILPAAGAGAAVALLGGLWFGMERTGDKPPPINEVKPKIPADKARAPESTATPSAPTATQAVPAATKPEAAPVAGVKPQPEVAKPLVTPPPVTPPTAAAITAAAPAAAPATPPAAMAKPAPAAPAVAAPAPAPAAPAVVAAAKPSPTPRESRVEAEPTPAPPAVEAAPAPPQVAIAPPTASKPAPAAQGGLPRQGESWTYRASGKWPSSPKRNFQIVVQSVADGVVTDALRVLDAAGGGGEFARSRGGKAEFVTWKDIGIEFSPYLAAQGEIAKLESQSGFPTPDLDGQWSQWYSQVKLIGQETINVPAGSFNSYKVEVWSNRHATGTRTMRPSEPVRVHYYVWYAPDVKRYIKMQRRVISATNNELDSDVFELVAQR